MKNDGGPAFPCEESHGDSHEGMSLRDYFAAAALQGILANSAMSTPLVKAASQHNISMIACTVAMAFEYADTMLAERAK